MTYPTLERMASGHHSILLELCSADDFPKIAAKWALVLGAVLGPPIFGPDQTQLEAAIAGSPFWFAWDVWQAAASLEPRDARAARMIPDLLAVAMRAT